MGSPGDQIGSYNWPGVALRREGQQSCLERGCGKFFQTLLTLRHFLCERPWELGERRQPRWEQSREERHLCPYRGLWDFWLGAVSTAGPQGPNHLCNLFSDALCVKDLRLMDYCRAAGAREGKDLISSLFYFQSMVRLIHLYDRHKLLNSFSR